MPRSRSTPAPDRCVGSRTAKPRRTFVTSLAVPTRARLVRGASPRSRTSGAPRRAEPQSRKGAKPQGRCPRRYKARRERRSCVARSRGQNERRSPQSRAEQNRKAAKGQSRKGLCPRRYGWWGDRDSWAVRTPRGGDRCAVSTSNRLRHRSLMVSVLDLGDRGEHTASRNQVSGLCGFASLRLCGSAPPTSRAVSAPGFALRTNRGLATTRGDVSKVHCDFAVLDPVSADGAARRRSRSRSPSRSAADRRRTSRSRCS
jgi:hypothetical protein